MKILGIFLNNEMRTGGHTRYLELMEGIAEKGHEVTVFMNEYLDRQPISFSARRVPVTYVTHKTLFIGRLFRKLILRTTRGERLTADWIVIFGETHWPAARALSRKYGIPILYALRSDSIEESKAYLNLESPNFVRSIILKAGIAHDSLRERSIARDAALIAFQSQHDRDRFVARNPAAHDKTSVIRGDIRQPRFKSEYANANSSSSCRRLLFVGTLGTRKGLAYLIRAIAKLPENLKSLVSLDILAAGSDAEYAPFAGMIAEYELGDRVRFHGKVPSPFEFMKSADLLVVPSLFDSYPNVVLEALHAALPAIGSRTGGIPDMLGYDELLFDPASVDSLVERLIPLVASAPAYLKARKLSAERRHIFDFDWADQWIEALDDANKRRHQ